MTRYLPRTQVLWRNGLLSSRAVATAGILTLHAVVAYLLATGMMRTTILHPLGRLLVVDVPIEKAPPPPPPPTLNVRNYQTRSVTLPDPDMPQYESPDPVFASLPTVADPAPPVSPPSVEAIRLVGHHQIPNSTDFYPPDLVRQRVEGAADLRVCVDERAAIQGMPAVERSSGDRQLDQAAVNLVRHARYALAMRGNTPVSNCYRFRIVFRIK